MRFFFLLPLLGLIACHKIQEDVGILDGYEVPFEPDVQQKIYTYVRMPGSDTIIHVFYFDNPHALTYQQTVFVNGEIISERHYAVNNNRKKLLREFYYEYHEGHSTEAEKLEGELKGREEIDLGHRFQGLRNKVSFTNADGFRTTFTEEDRSIKDTTFVIRGKSIPCLRIDYTETISEVIKYIPFYSHTQESEATAYFLKDIGFYQQNFVTDSMAVEMKLIAIKKIKRGVPSI